MADTDVHEATDADVEQFLKDVKPDEPQQLPQLKDRWLKVSKWWIGIAIGIVLLVIVAVGWGLLRLNSLAGSTNQVVSTHTHAISTLTRLQRQQNSDLARIKALETQIKNEGSAIASYAQGLTNTVNANHAIAIANQKYICAHTSGCDPNQIH